MTECSKIISLGNSCNVTRLAVDVLNVAFQKKKNWLGNTFFCTAYCINFRFIHLYAQVQI